MYAVRLTIRPWAVSSFMVVLSPPARGKERATLLRSLVRPVAHLAARAGAQLAVLFCPHEKDLRVTRKPRGWSGLVAGSTLSSTYGMSALWYGPCPLSTAAEAPFVSP